MSALILHLSVRKQQIREKMVDLDEDTTNVEVLNTMENMRFASIIHFPESWEWPGRRTMFVNLIFVLWFSQEIKWMLEYARVGRSP
jgi:hypothetical protein